MSFSLQEHVLLLQDNDEPYIVENELMVQELSEQEVMQQLEYAIDAVVGASESISSPKVFDTFQSLLKYFPSLSLKLQSKLLDTILSALLAECDSTTRSLSSDEPSAHLEHKTSLEQYAFLLQWFIAEAERLAAKVDEDPTGKKKKTKVATAKKGEKWNWAAQIPYTLNSIVRALKLQTSRIWTTTQERDAFVSCFTRPAFHLAENEAYMKTPEIKMSIYKVLAHAVKFHAQAFSAQTSIIQALQYFEHLSEPMADLLAIISKEFDHTQLTEEVLREISARRFTAQDTKGPRSFSKFLLRVATYSPELVLKQIGLLLVHLDSDAYPIRMAIVEAIGTLIQHLDTLEDLDPQMKQRQQRNFWDLLLDRFLDVNSYVRTKAITTVTKLLKAPDSKFTTLRPKITQLAIRHLDDKSASVRRYAILLLSELIITHPFGFIAGGELRREPFQQSKDRHAEDLAQREAFEMRNAPEGLRLEEVDETEEGADDEGEGEDGEERKPAIKVKREAREVSALPPVEFDDDNSAMMSKIRLILQYNVDALDFIAAISSAIPKLKDLLNSTGRAEVLETMDFFKIAVEYKLEAATDGIKAMLHLVWTKDNSTVVVADENGTELKGIRSKVIECYKELFLTRLPNSTDKQHIGRVSKNLIELTFDCTLAELTSLEELLRALMVGADALPADVIAKLWTVYSTDKDIPKRQRRGAIIVLGMLAVARKEIVTEKLDLLLRIGLGPYGKNDLVLARYSCVALQRISGSVKKVKGSFIDKSNRLPMDNPIFQRLADMLKVPSTSMQWFGVAEQALNAIYLLGEKPDLLAGDIVKALTVRVFESIPVDAGDQVAQGLAKLSVQDAKAEESQEKEAEDAPVQGEDAEMEVKASSVEAEDGIKPKRTLLADAHMAGSFELGQLVFVVGHVAIKHIVYLELVERELKHRKELAAKSAKASASAGKDAKGDDLDQVSGNAEDDIGDNMAFIREHELLYGEDSLLALYGPLISDICANPSKYEDTALRTSAVLSLSKLMCVSSQFCEQQLPLLFRVFETAPEPIIRCNIVIALGDVAVCFSNMIDENSDRLYQGLADSDIHVKTNTLMVLTHLILNGMIKVKGQLGEMAKCIEDDDKKVGDLARQFFKELSTKENALYNNLQDVISHLSVGKHAVDEETFEKTMRYIFTFIEKEKQAESIIEKLCQRFRLATDERQWRDIAFCLSLLPYKSEKSVKKLIDGLPFYQDKLHEEKVFKRMQEILAKARTNKLPNKPESELNEFEAILEGHRKAGTEGQELDAEVAVKVKASARRKAATDKGKKGAKTKEKKAPARKRKVVDSSDEEEADVAMDGEDSD